jgi:hypothetical protein
MHRFQYHYCYCFKHCCILQWSVVPSAVPSSFKGLQPQQQVLSTVFKHDSMNLQKHAKRGHEAITETSLGNLSMISAMIVLAWLA